MKIITAYDLGAEIARRQVAVAKTAADLGAITAVKQAANGGLGGFGPKPPSDPSGAQKRRSELGGFPPPPPGPSAEQAAADAQKRRGQIGNSPSNTPGNTPPPPPPTPKPQPGQGGFQNPITDALGQIGAGTNNAIDQFTNKIRESAARAQAPQPQPQPGAAPQQPSAELLRRHPELAQTGQQQISAQVPQQQQQRQPQTYNGQPMVYPGGQQQVEFSNFGGKPRYTHPIDMNNPVNQFHMQAAETRRQQLQPFLMPYEEGTVPPMPGTDYVPPTTEAFRRSSPPAGGASRGIAGGLGGAAGSALAGALPQPTQQTSHPRLLPRTPAGQAQAPAPAAKAPAPAPQAPAPAAEAPAPKPTYDANDPNLLEGKTPEEIASLRQGVNADMYPPEQAKSAPTPPDYGPRKSPPAAYAEQQKQRRDVGNNPSEYKDPDQIRRSLNFNSPEPAPDRTQPPRLPTAPEPISAAEDFNPDAQQQINNTLDTIPKQPKNSPFFGTPPKPAPPDSSAQSKREDKLRELMGETLHPRATAAIRSANGDVFFNRPEEGQETNPDATREDAGSWDYRAEDQNQRHNQNRAVPLGYGENITRRVPGGGEDFFRDQRPSLSQTRRPSPLSDSILPPPPPPANPYESSPEGELSVEQQVLQAQTQEARRKAQEAQQNAFKEKQRQFGFESPESEPPAGAAPPAPPPVEEPPRIQGQALPPSQYQQRYAPPQQQAQPQHRRGLFGRRR